jgi:hypothetical protein
VHNGGGNISIGELHYGAEDKIVGVALPLERENVPLTFQQGLHHGLKTDNAMLNSLREGRDLDQTIGQGLRLGEVVNLMPVSGKISHTAG